MNVSWLEVKTSLIQIVLIILFGFFLVPLGSLVLISGIESSSIKFSAIGFLLVFGYLVILWIIWRALSKSVKYFTKEGLERRDGHNFIWTDLSGITDRIHHRRGNVWRTEFHFKNGETAWLMWSYVSNYDEVESFVNNLPYERSQN